MFCTRSSSSSSSALFHSQSIEWMGGWMDGWMDGGGVRYGYLKLYRALSGITMMNISIGI